MIKQWLLRQGRLGSLAINARSALELFRASQGNPESLGMVANDVLALRLVTRLGLPHKTFVDVGAHIGSVLSQVRQLCPTMSIQAIEAMPDKAERLRASFRDVKVHAFAVGDHEGQVDFYVNSEESGYSSLLPQGPRAQVIHVPMQRIDNLIPDDPVDVMKIDVEGAELAAIKGAERLLARARPTLMYESGPLNFEATLALYTYLRQQDYIVLLPQRLAHIDDGLSESAYIDSHRYPRHSTNYFAVHASRRDELRKRARQVLGLHETN